MKKNELILSAVAAVVMTGCGGGSSSTTSGATGTASPVPTFATQEAEITTTAKVESATNTVTAVVDTFVATQLPTSKATARTSLTDKVMAGKVDKRVKTFGMRAKEKLASLKKKTMVTAACDPLEDVFEYSCSESGTDTMIFTQALNAEGQCVKTWTETASNCHDRGTESWSDVDAAGNVITQTWTWDDTYSGTYNMSLTMALDDQEMMHTVVYGYQDTFKGSGTETYEATGQAPVTFAYNDDVNYAVTFADGYTLTNGVFAYTDKWSVDEYGRANFSYSADGQALVAFAYVVDMTSTYDFSQANKFASTMDGYIDLRYSFEGATEQRFAIAAEALNVGYDWSVANEYTSTIDGKIGSHCTGGMIAVNTATAVSDDYTDSYLPFAGLMNFTGAAGTTASLEYFQNTDGSTYAEAKVGEQTKTYTTYAEMQGEACQGEFLNPMDF